MSTFGEHFRVTTYVPYCSQLVYGDSHCRFVGCIVDGCPPDMALTEADIQPHIHAAAPASLPSPRCETTRTAPRSSRALSSASLGTTTYLEKYGVKASSGGGRSSARETIGRVAACAIAEKYLRLSYGIEIVAFVTSVGGVHLYSPTAEHSSPSTNPEYLRLLQSIDRASVDRFLPVRCPVEEAARRMEDYIAEFRDRADNNNNNNIYYLLKTA